MYGAATYSYVEQFGEGSLEAKKKKTAQLRQNGVGEINRDVPRPGAIWSKLADVTPGFTGYSDI